MMSVCTFVSSHEYIVDGSLISTQNLSIITHLQYARTTFKIIARTPGPGLDFPQGGEVSAGHLKMITKHIRVHRKRWRFVMKLIMCLPLPDPYPLT